MAKNILYGVQKIFLEEIDETTELPIADGVRLEIDCAESVDVAAQVDTGENTILRCNSTNTILATKQTPDLTYAYQLTLVDAQLDLEVLALVDNATIIYGADGTTIIGVDSPPLGEPYNFKYFRLTMYVAIYTGNSITGYTRIVFNRCYGTAQSFTFDQSFFAPSFVIMATSAAIAGLPAYQFRLVGPDELPDTIDDLDPIVDPTPDTP